MFIAIVMLFMDGQIATRQVLPQPFDTFEECMVAVADLSGELDPMMGLACVQIPPYGERDA